MNITGKVFLKGFSISSLFVCIVIIGVSCKSTKTITKAISKKDTVQKKADTATAEDLHRDSLLYIQQVYKHIQAGIINCKTFSAKLRVHYEGSDGKDYELTAFVRLEKDKRIWISVNATLLGIEVFRVLITPDSAKVLNKVDKVYQLRSISYLQEISHLPFDFNVLQSVILGNPIFLDSNILYYRKDIQGISILSIGSVFRNSLTLNSDYSIKHSKLDDVDPLKTRSCDITYGQYEKKDTILFSTYRQIAVAETTRLDVEMSFNRYSFNDNLEFPFSIPKNYKRK
jgi:Domain of unknown function (DUF4292)